MVRKLAGMPSLRRLSLPFALAIALLASATASAAVPAGQACQGLILKPAARAVVASPALTGVIATGVRVCSPADLAATLSSSYSGRIVIPRDVFWDMTPYPDLQVKSGVEIVGERGNLGSRPTLYRSDKADEASMFDVVGNDVHINGIHFLGPKPVSDHANHTPYVNAISVVEDFDNQTGRRVLIDDNEFNLFSGGAVNVLGTHQVKDLKDWDPSWVKPQPADASLVMVKNNYMHDNVMDGGGYGFVVGGGSYATAQDNLFDNNRHAVAASGKAYSGYVARFNYVLHGGTKQGNYYNQHFDVHGVGSGGYGGMAGTYFDISFNAVEGAQSYYVVKTRPVLMLRGRPTMGMFFHDNVFEADDLDAAVALTTGGLSGLGIGEDEGAFNFHKSGNTADVNYSTEIASGDFDGDGQTDIFVANGTSWWYSKGGLMPWQQLHESTKRTRDLAFADIDNDGKTDVLYRDSAGNLGYLSGGTVALKPLTTLPVPIGQLRFGDFDGDGKTDMFYTRNGQWYVWYGKTRTWTTTQTSSFPVTSLAFGDFDNVKGTDVAAVEGGGWSLSSGSTGGWTRFNSKLASTLQGAVVADFNGDGRDDIGVTTSGGWSYSSGGRGPLVTMRSTSNPAPISSVQIGHFDRKPQVEAVAFAGYRLAFWKGVGQAPTFYTRSLQDMR